jgi:hypothetical protein
MPTARALPPSPSGNRNIRNTRGKPGLYWPAIRNTVRHGSDTRATLAQRGGSRRSNRRRRFPSRYRRSRPRREPCRRESAAVCSVSVLTLGMDVPPDPLPRMAEYYRYRAAEARRAAKAATTAPVRTRLLDMAREFDRIAAAAARATAPPPRPES